MRTLGVLFAAAALALAPLTAAPALAQAASTAPDAPAASAPATPAPADAAVPDPSARSAGRAAIGVGDDDTASSEGADAARSAGRAAIGVGDDDPASPEGADAARSAGRAAIGVSDGEAPEAAPTAPGTAPTAAPDASAPPAADAAQAAARAAAGVGNGAAPASQQAPSAGASPQNGAPAAPGDGAAASPARSLNVGVLTDAPPFSALGRFGVRSGFDVDVAFALCTRMNARCNLLPYSPDDIVGALLDRRIDFALAALAPTPRLDELIDFTDPYVRLAVRFVTPRTVSADLESEGDAIYAALAGSAQADDLTRTYTRSGQVRLYGNEEEMWIDLAMGRLSGVLALAVNARQDFLSTPLGEAFRFADAGATVRDFGRVASAAVRNGDQTLQRALNAAIADLLASPDYSEILSRHLDGDLAGPPSAAN